MTESIATIRYLTTASFGFGASGLLPEVLAELGIARPLVVTDPGVRAIAGRVVTDQVTWFDRAPANPTEARRPRSHRGSSARRAATASSAIGGGSPIDLAKGVALLATHPAPLADYAAIIGGVERITAAPAPDDRDPDHRRHRQRGRPRGD